MAENKTIVTIGRAFASNGLEIGRTLAEQMGVQCYDKELIDLAAKESGLCEEILESHDEAPTRSFLYSLVMDTYSMGYHTGQVEMPMEQKVFLAQYNTIKKLAENQSCVIVGRCADYALEGKPGLVRVFLTADMEDRIKFVMEHSKVNEEKAKDMIVKADKKRSSYYNYYSNKRWGDSESYDLCINVSRVGFDGAVEAIADFINLKKRHEK